MSYSASASGRPGYALEALTAQPCPPEQQVAFEAAAEIVDYIFDELADDLFGEAVNVEDTEFNVSVSGHTHVTGTAPSFVTVSVSVKS
jgi:hypothetical protein